MDRLRNRDLRTNNNKCYTMYFDDDQNKDITNKTMPTKKTKTRSPRKKEPTKNYQADSTSTDSMALNQIGLHGTSDETKTHDAVAVNESNVTASTDGNRKIASKPLELSETVVGDNVNAAGNGNDGIQSSTNSSQRMNNGNMVDITTTLSSDSMDNNKPSDLQPAKANDSTNDPNAMELGRKDRKRRLSQSNDRPIEVEDDDDEDAESCGTDDFSSISKKAKIEFSRGKMYQIYQPWVIKTYGDLAKKKTITNKKHERILIALNGLEQNNPDSSKFRFWVKAKGFTTEKPPNFKEVPIFEASDTIDSNNAQSNGIASMQTMGATMPVNDTIKTHL